jgi:hypothetical protein
MKEYKALSDDQQDELKAWRDSNEGKASIAASKKKYLDTKGSSPVTKKNKHGKDGNGRRVKFKTTIATMVTDIMQSQAKKQDEQAQINAITANMISHMTLSPAPTVATVTTTPVVAATSASGPSPNLTAARLVKLMGAAAAGNASNQ